MATPQLKMGPLQSTVEVVAFVALTGMVGQLQDIKLLRTVLTRSVIGLVQLRGTVDHHLPFLSAVVWPVLLLPYRSVLWCPHLSNLRLRTNVCESFERPRSHCMHRLWMVSN
jgi:hypothetical protein